MRDIIVTSAFPDIGEIVTVYPGTVTGYIFTLGIDENIQLSVVHMPGGADFSIRVWISDTPGGNPIVRTPPNASEWSANRATDEAGDPVVQTVVIRDISRSGDTETTSAVITVPSGIYYLCTENRTNSEVFATISLQTI
jgi:hypothetical protein